VPIKQLQKLKKRTEGSGYSLKGRAVLDQMLATYSQSNKISNHQERIKDPSTRRLLGGHAVSGNEQSGLWSFKDTFVRNVKGDQHSGWALIQLEIDDRKNLADTASKEGFRLIRESVSKHLQTYISKKDIGGGECFFFDLNIYYMLLISNQNEQKIKPLARNILNYIAEQNILHEHNIAPLPGIDAITLSAGAVMYNGEEDYLRWSRKADEALEYGRTYGGSDSIGNWEQYQKKNTYNSCYVQYCSKY